MRLTRTTLILLAANAVCGLLLWRALPDRAAAAERSLAFPVAPAWVEVEGPAGKLRLERADAGWRVASPYRWAANPWEVQRLLGELALVRETGPRTPRQAGAERWTVRAAAEGADPVEATVLAESLPGGGRIAHLDGGNRGSATAGEPLIKALAQPPEAFRLDAIFTLPPFEVRNLGVRRVLPSGEERRWGLVLETRETVGRAEPTAAWRFEAPENLLADPERLPRALASLTDLRVARFLDRRTQAESKPWLRLSLESAGRREVLVVWPPAEGLCEAILEDNPGQPFLVEHRAVAPWADPVTELRSRLPFDFDPAGARGLVLTELRDGRSLTLHRLEGTGADGRWEMPVVAGSTATRRREVSVGRVQQFLRLLTGLRAGEPASPPTAAAWKRLDLEFAGGRLTCDLAADPAGGRIFVRGADGSALACPTDLPLGRWLSVDPNDWRSEVLTRLTEGAKVVRLTLSDAAKGETVAEARLGEDGRWAAEGEIDAASAARLAAAMSVVEAASFSPETLTVATPEPRWKHVLKVVDRAAAGAAGATESERRYRVSAAEGPGSLRLRDETDGTVFVPATDIAEALAPWTAP